MGSIKENDANINTVIHIHPYHLEKVKNSNFLFQQPYDSMCKHLPTTGDIFKKNVTGYRQMLEKCQWFKANA